MHVFCKKQKKCIFVHIKFKVFFDFLKKSLHVLGGKKMIFKPFRLYFVYVPSYAKNGEKKKSL